MAHQPGFIYNKVTVSEEGLKLADKFRCLLQTTVGKEIDDKNHPNLREKWASKFDAFLKSNTFEHICEVFDFYVAEIIKKLKAREKP